MFDRLEAIINNQSTFCEHLGLRMSGRVVSMQSDILESKIHGVRVHYCVEPDITTLSRMSQNVASPPTSNGSVVSDCTAIRQSLFTNYYLSFIGLGIAVLMSFLERRRNFHKDKCFGRPGALVPINLINGDKFVLSHSAAFGCTVGSVFFTFLDSIVGQGSDYGNAWLKSFAVFAKMMDLGLQYYPLFVCVEYNTNNLYAPVIGLLYSVFLLFLHIVYIVVCNVWLNFFILLPVLACLLYLVILFIRNFCITILRLFKRNTEAKNGEIQTFASNRNKQYVRLLFSSKREDESDNNAESLKEKILEKAAKRKACLQTEVLQRSSNRIASIFVVSGVLLYQWFVFCVKLSQILQDGSSTLKQRVKGITFLSNHTTFISRSLDAITGSFYAATVAAGIIVIVNMYMIYSSHRRHISRLLAGNYTFIPKKCWDMKPSVILAKNIKYPGFQIGHIVWGFLLNFLVVLIVCLLLSFFLIMPIVYTVPDSFSSIIRTLLPVFSVSFVFYLCIIRVCSIFLQSDVTEIDGKTKKNKVLAITNWRAYQNFSYFMFFFYIFVGIFSCFGRILVSAAIGFYYLARLDKCILARGLEHFDTSYMAYVAFLRIQVSHSNPVVTTFCELLVHHAREFKFSKSTQMSDFPVEDGERNQHKNTLPRRRWFKAVTLLRNPTLVSESKPRLLEKKNPKQGIEDDVTSDENNIV